MSIELERLIYSLSAAEKKFFLLHAGRLGGPKDYLLLYEMVVQRKRRGDQPLHALFAEKHPGKSFANTANYLYKVLTDVLVQIRIEQDTWYKQYHSLMKARLCFERSLPGRASRELQKVAKLAAESQNLAVSYQAARMELTAAADMGFAKMDEQTLVTRQMKAKQVLRSLRQLHEHYSLYELLSFRLGRGKLRVDNVQDKKVNDLILSELALTTRGSRYHFESQKLHLLFQSFFLIHTGNYRAALKIFNELNGYMEAHERMWDYPPYDYLSALDGILDSLRSIGYFNEMEPFIDRIASLLARSYPEHFNGVAQLTAHAYRLNMYLGAGNIDQALSLLEKLSGSEPHLQFNDNREKQMECLYFESLACFLSGKRSRVFKTLNLLFDIGKPYTRQPVYRAGRLLHILLICEQGDPDYLDYETRSYKRTFSKQGKSFKIEKLIFATLTAEPWRRGNQWKTVNAPKITARVADIRADRKELNLLKYYDYGAWVLSQYDVRPATC